MRGARTVAVTCAVAFFAPIVLSLAFPRAFFSEPYHREYERLVGAVLLSFGLGLLLAMRDPIRNAGVYAVIGLATGFICASTVYSLAVHGGDPLRWWVQVPLLAVLALVLVVTYTRLRRPHPVVVRIVVGAVVALPLALALHDLAYRTFVDPV